MQCPADDVCEWTRAQPRVRRMVSPSPSLPRWGCEYGRAGLCVCRARRSMAGATDGCKRRRAPSSEAQTTLEQIHTQRDRVWIICRGCMCGSDGTCLLCLLLAAGWRRWRWAGLAGWLVPWPSLPAAALVALNSRKGRPGRSAHILTYLTTLGEVSPSPASRQIIIYLF